MVRCVVKTRRMIFVVKNYQVNVPIFFRVQLVIDEESEDSARLTGP